MTGNAIREALEPIRVGDLVRVVANVAPNHPHQFPIGTVLPVLEVHEDGSGVDLGEWACRLDEVERVPAHDAIGSGLKALEWSEITSARSDEDPSHEPTGDYEAVTGVGIYYVECGFGTDRYFFSACLNGDHISSHDDPDEAKAAAQADFDRRVLSCLSPVAVAEADAKAERKGHTPSDEEMDEATIRQRDIAEDAADKLAEAIGELLGVNVGEHSSAHSPWETALEHAGQAVRNRALSTYTAAGAGPVGEAVAEGWTGQKCAHCQGHGRRMVGDDEATCPDCGGTGEEYGPHYARPVEEPGEVERLTRERDEARALEAHETAIREEACRRADAATASLAETRERLEKLLAAVGKARTALAGFTSADDAAFAIDVVVGEVADWKRRAALTGDAQEASPMEKLGKFGWHPDPVIDFEVEIEKLESRFDCAMRGTSKPGERAETVQAVHDDIRRAMTFKAGGTVEGVVAKNRLRDLEAKAIAASAGDA